MNVTSITERDHDMTSITGESMFVLSKNIDSGAEEPGSRLGVHVQLLDAGVHVQLPVVCSNFQWKLST